MKDFRGTYIFQPNGSVNKGNGVKEHLENDECDCFTPFVKVHHFDCPLVKKPCPIHGEKVVRDANRCMFISFHPSLRNDNLFQPFQNLLTESYDYAFKKNQYCLPKNCKYIVKNRLVQTKSEDLKNFSNSYITEKPKSFVADKTSKIKKLKQCFHSPCESVTQKSQSQTSIKENISDIFWDKLNLTKDDSGPGNKELTQKSLDDMCLGPGSDNDYNSDCESPFQINKFSTIKVGINSVDQHVEGHQAKSKDLKDFGGKNFSFANPYMYYSSVSQESLSKINATHQNIQNQHHEHHPKTNTKDQTSNSERRKNDRPRRERDKADSETSSVSTKSSNSESSGSVLYTPYILVPKGMDKSSDNKIVVPSRELTDKMCQTSRKYLFREISASTQTASKADQCPCIEKIKSIGPLPDGHLTSSPKNFHYANTQTSKHLINNNFDMFDDEGAPKKLSSFAPKEHRGSIKSESSSQRNGKETDRKPLFLKSEHKKEEPEIFDDEGTPKRLRSPPTYNKRNERGSEESKENVKKNMTDGEDTTQSSDSSKSESNVYKYDFNKKNELVVKRKNTYVGNQIRKKKGAHSEDSFSSTSESIEASSKISPTKVRNKLLDDEYYNEPHRPGSNHEWNKKLQVQNVNHTQEQAPAPIISDVNSFPKGDAGNKNDQGSNKNQNFLAKHLDTPSSKLSKETVIHNYRNDADKFDNEENPNVSYPYETSPKHKFKSGSKTSQLSKQSRTSNLNNVEEKLEKNNSNEKISRLRTLAEGVTNWPNNMNQFKDPILQEIGKSQDYVLKNSENVASSPRAEENVSHYNSRLNEPVMHSASHAVPINKKNEAIQNLESEHRPLKNKICLEEQLLNSLEEEILQWPDTMNFCKETLVEQIQKCRNSEAMQWIMSKEPSEFKEKPSQYRKMYDDDQSSQILDSYNFSEAEKDKSQNNDESKGNYEETTEHLRTLSEEIIQLPVCEGSCKEQLLDWVRSRNVQNTAALKLTEPKEKTVEITEALDDEKHRHPLREELPKEKEPSQNELFDWARRSQHSFNKSEETTPLKSTETQILQPRDQAVEAEELPVKKEHEKERCKSEYTPQKKIKNEEEAFLRMLEEEMSCYRNMIIEKIQQYRHLRSKSADTTSAKSLEDGNGTHTQMKEIFCKEKISSYCGCKGAASQKKKHKNQFVNPEEEYSHVQKKKESPCNSEHTVPHKPENEVNGMLPKDHTENKNISTEVKESLRSPIEIEENTFEIKKPFSYEATSICHTSIKFGTNSSKLTQTGESEISAVNVKKVKGSHTTYVLNSFSSSDSDENETVVNKCMCKSLSDGFIFEKKTASANEVQLTQTAYYDPAQSKTNTSSNDGSKGIHQRIQDEEVSGDIKTLNKVAENSPNVQENNKTKNQKKPKECSCIKDRVQCIPVADFSELYQLIHQRFDKMSSELSKFCQCHKFSKPDLVDKTVMTDSISANSLPRAEFPNQIVKREIPCETQILEDLKNFDCDKDIISLICDKCTKTLISTKSVGTNTDFLWPKPKTVEKGIVCEMSGELKNETKLREKFPEKSQQRNNKQNSSLESAKDAKSPVSPKTRVVPLKNADAGPSLPRQNDVENKAKPVNPRPEIKNNENRYQNEQTISKKIEVNCETLKKNTNITNCATQRSPSTPKLKPKRSPLSSGTRILDNSPAVTKTLIPETRTIAVKNNLISKPAATKPMQQPCTSHLLDPNCVQPSTSYQPQQNFFQNRGCICSEVNQQLRQTEERQHMKISASDYVNKEKNKFKKNSFMYHAQVLQPFLRIYNENLVAQFAEYCDTDYECKFMKDFDSVKKLFPTSLKEFDKNKQKRTREKENSSGDDYPADKKSKILEFGELEKNKFDDEYHHSVTKQKAKENFFDLEKLGKKLTFYQSFSDPEFRIGGENRDIIFSELHKSEETLKKANNKQKIQGKRALCLTEKFLNNENCQRKSTGYLNCVNDQKQKLIKCRMCKSLTYLENADWRSILKFQEYLLIEKAKNDFNLMDKILMFSLNSLNDEKCSLNILGDK